MTTIQDFCGRAER